MNCIKDTSFKFNYKGSVLLLNISMTALAFYFHGIKLGMSKSQVQDAFMKIDAIIDKKGRVEISGSKLRELNSLQELLVLNSITKINCIK